MLPERFLSWFTEAPPIALASLPLPPEIAEITSETGDPVTMTSRAWSGGRFRIVRATLMTSASRIQVFNLVAYPHTDFASPIFATDVVIMRNQLRIGVIDAMPLFAEEADYHLRWVAPFQPLADKSRLLGPRFELKLDWSREYLGSSACLITGVEAADLEGVAALWEEYWKLYLNLFAEEAPAPLDVRARVEKWHRDYNEEHAEVELKRNPLMRYYGAEYGSRFIREFLFSDTLGLA